MINTATCSRYLLRGLTKRTDRTLKTSVRAFGNASNLWDIQVNTKTGVATVSMNRPPVNSLSLEMIRELNNAMMQIEKDKGRGMVITSAVPGIFTSGLDIMELYQPNPDRIEAYWTALQDMWLNLYGSAYPTAAAIVGHSAAGGCLIACSCDFRVMVEGKYRIGMNETQLGLVAPSWVLETFKNVVPKREAEHALITGKLFQAEEALKVGLVDELVTDNKTAVEKAADYITKLARLNYQAMAQTKLTVRYTTIKHLRDTREHDLKAFVKFLTSPEVQNTLETYLKSLKEKKKSN